MSPRQKVTSARNTRRQNANTNRKKTREPKLSHLRRPGDLPVEAWQTQLRRQFGRVQAFALENIGDEPVFSEFRVTNPQSGGNPLRRVHGSRPMLKQAART